MLRHSFPSSGRPEFAMLPSIFGGEDDTLVLRAEIGAFAKGSVKSYADCV